MGSQIPIFFAPVPANSRGWSEEDVMEFVGAGYDDREKSRLRTSVSRNWWHIRVLLDASSALQSSALDFLDEPSACLAVPEVTQAIQTLAVILTNASIGLIELGSTTTAEANEFFLKKDTGEKFSGPQEAYLHAFLEAKPSFEVDWSGDAGYRASVGYFAFLKTLFLCLAECLIEGKHLLYYRPN